MSYFFAFLLCQQLGPSSQSYGFSNSHVWMWEFDCEESWVPKPRTRENISLDELRETWMAKMNENCIFISAREKTNLEGLKKVLYDKVRELHVQKYPYNDFLFEKYDEE